jgi:PST family polysaccharide transporter
MAIGLAAIAPALVRVILGEAWWSLTPMLVVLSALSVLRPVGWLVAAYLQAKAQTRTVFGLEAIKAVAVAALVLTLGQISLLWACVGVGLAFAVHALASLWVVHRDDNLSLGTLARPFLQPLLACMPMVLCVVGVNRLAEHFQMVPWAALLLAVASGVVSYMVGALTLAAKQSRDLLSLVRDALGRGRDRTDDVGDGPVEGATRGA